MTQEEKRKRHNEYTKKWRKTHKEQYAEYRKTHDWRITHKEQYAEYRKKRTESQKRPLVYLYKENDEIVYIGSTCHLQNRLRNRKYSKHGNKFDFIYRSDPERFKFDIMCYCDTIEEARNIEAEQIRKYNPKYNIIGTGTHV